MITVKEAIARYGVDVDPHLDRQATVPVVSRLGRQGDVLIVAVSLVRDAGQPVPIEGLPVVRGEVGGNTHLLLASGDVRFQPAARAGQVLGVLTVADNATAYLAHPEHSYLGVAPGVYEVRRQREQRDVIALVAD